MLPLLGGIVAPILGFLVYKFSRRRLRVKDSSRSRAYIFYRILSGALLGQFLCHTNVIGGLWGLEFMYLFVVAGYMLFGTAEDVGRVWNTNVNYIGPSDGATSLTEDIALDKERMEEKPIAVIEDVTSHDFSAAVWMIQDKQKDRNKRQWILFGLMVVLACITVLDGMMLVYRNPTTPEQVAIIIVCFFGNGISLSTAFYGAMIHARMHVNSEARTRVLWWTFVAGIWCAMLACASIPVLIGMQVTVAAEIVNSVPFVVVYGVAAGCILAIQQYFYGMKMETTDKRDILWGRLVFVAAIGQSAATGFWL